MAQETVSVLADGNGGNRGSLPRLDSVFAKQFDEHIGVGSGPP